MYISKLNKLNFLLLLYELFFNLIIQITYFLFQNENQEGFKAFTGSGSVLKTKTKKK